MNPLSLPLSPFLTNSLARSVGVRDEDNKRLDFSEYTGTRYYFRQVELTERTARIMWRNATVRLFLSGVKTNSLGYLPVVEGTSGEQNSRWKLRRSRRPSSSRRFLRYVFVWKMQNSGRERTTLTRRTTYLQSIDAIYLGAEDDTTEFIHGALANTAARTRMKRGSH